MEPVRLLVDLAEEVQVDRLVMQGAINECFRIRFDRRKRGLQLVGRIGDEVLTHPFEATQVRHVMEDEHRPRSRHAGQRRAVDLQLQRRPAHPVGWGRDRDLGEVGLQAQQGHLDRLLHLRAPDSLGDQPAHRLRSQLEEAVRRVVCKEQAATGIDGDNPLGHPLEHCSEQLPIALQPIHLPGQGRRDLVEDIEESAGRAHEPSLDRPRVPPLVQRPQAPDHLPERLATSPREHDQHARDDRDAPPPTSPVPSPPIGPVLLPIPDLPPPILPAKAGPRQADHDPAPGWHPLCDPVDVA